jgi:hypothetical protein
MSIYTDCVEKIEQLMTKESVFTELDVLEGVAHKWPEEDWRSISLQANQAVGNAFRRQKVCRYGPVTLPDGSEDYFRIAAKIAYASADLGPANIETPNGNFNKLLWSRDSRLSSRSGRLPANNRDDTKPWQEQGLKFPFEPNGQCDRLEARVIELIHRVNELEKTQAKIVEHI